MAIATTATADEYIQALLRRPYRRVVQGDSDDGFLAFVPEWPGCVTAGATPAEALARLEDAMALWATERIAMGLDVPGPSPMPSDQRHRAYSGQFRVRLPASLHRDLALAAECEGVSLNAFVVAALARETGRRASIGSADVPADAEALTLHPPRRIANHR